MHKKGIYKYLSIVVSTFKEFAEFSFSSAAQLLTEFWHTTLDIKSTTPTSPLQYFLRRILYQRMYEQFY